MKPSLLTASLLASALSALSPAADHEMLEKGNTTAGILFQKLGGEVKMQMELLGVPGTLHYCSQNALALTDQVAKETGTSIKRSSLKNRNPANAANAQEAAVLMRWEKMAQEGKSLPQYELQRLSDTSGIYYKPIIINNEACLKCHGEIAAGSPVNEAIRATYPDDKATGYKMGDLRGMIAITITE